MLAITSLYGIGVFDRCKFNVSGSVRDFLHIARGNAFRRQRAFSALPLANRRLVRCFCFASFREIIRLEPRKHQCLAWLHQLHSLDVELC